MRLRIRLQFRSGQPAEPHRWFALAIGRAMMPLSAAAFLLALWQLGAGLEWTASFAISEGLLSHWQVWLGLAVILQIAGSVLARYGRGDGAAIP